MNPDGTKRLADNTLVALTLMIAESKTEEKDVMVKVVWTWLTNEPLGRRPKAAALAKSPKAAALAKSPKAAALTKKPKGKANE